MGSMTRSHHDQDYQEYINEKGWSKENIVIHSTVVQPINFQTSGFGFHRDGQRANTKSKELRDFGTEPIARCCIDK
jgi:hypothetical protein